MKSIHKHNINEYKQVYKTDIASKSYEVRSKVDVLIRYIPKLKTDSKILEIGYGTGDLLHKLSQKYPKAQLVGAEVVKEALVLYKKRFAKDKNVRLFLANAEKKLSFNNMKFDAVILSHVLEHIKDEGKFLNEVLGMLEKKGIIVIAVPDWGESDLHYRQYNKKELTKIAKNYKLKLILLKGDGFYINKFFYKLLFLVGCLAKEGQGVHTNEKKPVNKNYFNIFLRNIYYNFAVKILLILNRLDYIIYGNIDKHPVQWIAIYKKN